MKKLLLCLSIITSLFVLKLFATDPPKRHMNPTVVIGYGISADSMRFNLAANPEWIKDLPSGGDTSIIATKWFVGKSISDSLSAHPSGKTYNFSNGLTESSGNVSLGGNLSNGYITFNSPSGITGNYFNLYLTDDYSSNYLSSSIGHANFSGSMYSGTNIYQSPSDVYLWAGTQTPNNIFGYVGVTSGNTDINYNIRRGNPYMMYQWYEGGTKQNILYVDSIGLNFASGNMDSTKFSNTSILTRFFNDKRYILRGGSGYVTSESDPIFTASASYGITSTDITNWNSKEPALGNPSTDGYLLSSSSAGARSWINPATLSPIKILGNSCLSSYSLNSNASADNSIFFGENAGNNSSSAGNSIFLGTSAGNSATSANTSIFLGFHTGEGSTNASSSTFSGYGTGTGAVNSSNSVFIGTNAGQNMPNSSYSIFLGTNTGSFSYSNPITLGSNNIIIGTNVSLPNGRSNGLNIGGLIFGRGLYSDLLSGAPSIVAVDTAKMGIGVVNPQYKLDVAGDVNITGNFKVNGVNISTGGITSETDPIYTAGLTTAIPALIHDSISTLNSKIVVLTDSVNNLRTSLQNIIGKVSTDYPPLSVKQKVTVNYNSSSSVAVGSSTLNSGIYVDYSFTRGSVSVTGTFTIIPGTTATYGNTFLSTNSSMNGVSLTASQNGTETDLNISVDNSSTNNIAFDFNIRRNIK